MFAALVEIILGLWWVAVTATTAMALGMYASWNGVVAKTPGMIGASAVGCIATSYWLDVFDVAGGVTMDMRRGAGIVLWPMLTWVIADLIVEWRKVPTDA